MDWDDFKARRQELADDLHSYFETVEPCDLNPIIGWILATPVLLLSLIAITLLIVWRSAVYVITTLIKLVAFPLFVTYVSIDAWLIVTWFFWKTIKKLAEKEQ